MSARTFYAVEAGISRAPFTQWVGRCSNPRLLVVSQATTNADHAAHGARSVPASQLPTQTKKPDVLVTPGFRYSVRIGTAECHVRNG